MYRLPVLFGIIALLCMASCASSDKDTATYRILDESLQQANKTIQEQNATVYAAIEENLKEIRNERRASEWHPKAMQIQQHSTSLRRYIDSLKEQLKKEAGLRWNNGIELFHEKDVTAVNELFIEQGKAQELFNKLKQYKQAVLAVDSNMKRDYQERLTLTATADADTENNANTFTSLFFDGKTTAASLTMLSRLQNSLAIAENRLARYCYENSYTTGFIYHTNTAIISQSSTYVRSGEEVTINAGVGAFSMESRPEILINGKQVPIAADGVAHYKWKAPRKPGRYQVPTQITYVDQDGNRQTITKNIMYTVADTSHR